MAADRHLALATPDSGIGSTALFIANGRAWTVDDAVADADARGALDDAIRETLALIAAEEQDFDLDPRKLQEASDRYRYDHDWISAGDTEEWLERRGMSTDDFSRWLQQTLSVAELGSSEPDEVPDDFPDALRIHLWLSGRMADLERELRRRVAAEIEVASRGESLTGHDAVERLRAQALSEDARRRKLATQRLALAKFEIDRLDLDSEEAAREARLCVVQDRISLAEVAADAGFRDQRGEVWMDALDESIAGRLAGAAPGDVIGPVRNAERFTLYQLVRRIEPSLDHPEVARRIDQMLIDEFFEDLCLRHIQVPESMRVRP